MRFALEARVGGGNALLSYVFPFSVRVKPLRVNVRPANIASPRSLNSAVATPFESEVVAAAATVVDNRSRANTRGAILVDRKPSPGSPRSMEAVGRHWPTLPFPGAIIP